MTDLTPMLLSDYILEALANLDRARKAVQDEKIVHRQAVVHAITEAEKDLAHVLGLIAGGPHG